MRAKSTIMYSTALQQAQKTLQDLQARKDGLSWDYLTRSSQDQEKLNKQIERQVQLVQQLGESQRRSFDEFKSPKTDAEKRVTGLDEARTATEAQLSAHKTAAMAEIEADRRTATARLQMGKITVDQEIALEKGLVSQKLQAELAYLEGKKQLAEQHAKDTLGFRAGPEIAALNAQERAAQASGRGEQATLDAKAFTAQYEAHKQAIQDEIAATKRGTQQHAILEQSLAEYVRSVWGEGSRQYLEVQRQRIEADRQWAEAQKRAMEEASRATDEYLRKSKELTAQGDLDKALGQVKTQEVAVKGQAQTGRISP